MCNYGIRDAARIVLPDLTGEGRLRGKELMFMRDMMKVAIAKDGDSVSEHFGHCMEYALYVIENARIVSYETLVNPGHEPGRLPALLAEHQVTHVLAGGMGPKAVELFCANDIEVFLGVQGRIETVIGDFIAGRIAPGESRCTHGPGHEGCDH